MKIKRFLLFLLVLCMVLPMAACGDKESIDKGEESEKAVGAGALFEALCTTVKFDSAMLDAGKSAKYAYAGLPEGATVTMYTAEDGHFADELTWIALADEQGKEDAMKIVEDHVASKREQFVSYEQGEVPKIDGYKIWSDSKNIILCISSDETVQKIMENPQSYVKDVTPPEPSSGDDATKPEDDQPDQPTEPPVTEPPKPEAYPTVTAQNTAISKYNTYLAVDNVGYEYYNYSDSSAENYAELVSIVANQLKGETNVYSMVIPTAIGITFPDNVKDAYSPEDQAACLQKIYGKMDSSVIPVNIYDKLMQHRDEYLYYRTDWHWTGTGAYYGYEGFCEVKGIPAYTMAQRQEHISEGYTGLFSSGTSADTIYAYDPYYKDNVEMVYTDQYGNSGVCPVIRDGVAAYWYVFAAGDQPYIEFTNSAVTDGSVAIVVKESFGNALMSYICDHYSKVYEIDYRYWQGDLVDFAREVGADDIIFANNIGMVRSDYLLGKLATIIPL